MYSPIRIPKSAGEKTPHQQPARKYFIILILIPILTAYLFTNAAFRYGTPGFRVDKTQHGLYISKVFTKINPVQTGDLIVKINGLPYTRVLGILLLGSPPEDHQQTNSTITIRRNSQLISFTPKYVPLSRPDYLYIAWPHLLLVSLFLLLACLALLLAKPSQPAGIFFFMLCWFATTITTTLPSHFGLLDPKTISQSFLIITISNWLAFGGLAHFIARFPQERDLCHSRPYLVWIFYLATPILALGCTLYATGITINFFGSLQRFRNLCVPLIILGTFLKHLVDLHSLQSPFAKNQVKLSLAAYGMTFTPYLFFYLLPNLFFDQPLISFRIVLLAAIILPTAYLIALLRYRLLGVDRLISRSAAYILVIFFLVLSYIIFLAGLKRWLFGNRIFSEELFLLFIIIVALAVNPLINHTQKFIDRYFFRYRPEDDKLLFEFSKELSATLELSTLIFLITHTLPQKLQITNSSLLLLEKGYSRLYPEHLRIGSTPWPKSRLVQQFNEGKQFIFCHEKQSDPELNLELQELHTAGYILTLPLHGDSSLSGILLLGSRKDERLFREQDIRLLATLTNQISVALTNSLHYTSLVESKEQLENLFSKLVQTEKMAALGEISATLAHEIKNPLGIIRSSAQYLAQDTRPAEINQEMLHYIIDEVDSLDTIITNILGLAKFKNPNFKPVNLQQELTTLCARWQESGDHNPDITIHCTVARRLPVLHADFSQIRQVLLNLFLNSEEALAGRGVISLNAERQDDFILIRLLDDGPGIAEKHIDKLFGKFFTTKKDGLGLGLAICKRIIEAHHGTITMGNRKGGGTEVLIHLPFQPLMTPMTKDITNYHE